MADRFKSKKGVSHDALVKEYASLAMIRALPDFFLESNTQHGRRVSLLGRTRKAVDSILQIYPYYDDAMKKEIADLVDRFNSLSGLHTNGRHIITMICFCLELAEWLSQKSPWPAGGYYAQTRFIRDQGLRHVLKNLEDLFLYYEELPKNVGILKPCINGGRALAEKWKEVLK